MTGIPVHALEDAPVGGADGLAAVHDRYGMFPDIYAQLADAPALLNGLDSLARVAREAAAQVGKVSEP